MSTSLQPVVLAGMSRGKAPRGASHGVGPARSDSAAAENPVLRVDTPEGTGCRAAADETADPVDSPTSAAAGGASLEKTLSLALANVANADLLESILAAKAVQVEVTVNVNFPDSSRHCDFHLDAPQNGQSRLAAADKPVDVSAFTASEEAFLRRCLKPSLPPAYVDAVIRIVSQSREEMVQELENCLDQRTRQLYEAVNVINHLIREKQRLEGKAAHLEQTRSNLRKIHTTLRGVRHALVESRHGASIR